MKIAVVTVALPERAAMLAENIASVSAQTLAPHAHLIGIDHARVGAVANLNRLARLAVDSGCDWVAQLADDDLADPCHLATLAAHTDGADIVYPWCRVTGRPWNPNQHFDAAALRQGNYIPATTLIRSDLIVQLGYWRSEAAHGFEDWDFWLRALDVGARFVCVPTVTWTYRFWGGNFSWPTAPEEAPVGEAA